MKKAIILGGTNDHIKLISILKAKGYYTILIDYYENPPAKKYADKHIKESTLDVDKILEIALEIKPEIVIATCIDQSLLTMAFICEKLDLPCHISYQTALELTNKVYMKRLFFSHNIPTTKFIVIDDINIMTDLDLKFPVVVKPADSNSSKGVYKIFNQNRVEAAIRNAFTYSRSHEVVIEEYAFGEEFSVDVIVNDFEPTIILVSKNIKYKKNKNNFTIIQSLYPATNDNKII